MIQGSSSGTGQETFLSPERPDRLGGPYSPLFKGYRRRVREFDHSPPSSAEVKNEWRCTFNAPVLLHVVDRDKFTFAKQCNSFYKR
jgi:hypothetical protein